MGIIRQARLWLLDATVKAKVADPEKIADAAFGREDEKKEPCIECGIPWYVIHFRDGLCHSCQTKGAPGLSVRMKRIRTKSIIRAICSLVVFLGWLALVIYMFTK